MEKESSVKMVKEKSEIDHSSIKDDLVLCFDIELKVKTTEKSQMKSDWYLIQTNMTSQPWSSILQVKGSN